MTTEDLPEDIALSLLRGAGAFIRATPTQDLPASVRRFKGFRNAALVRQRDELLRFLFDETIRPQVAEWIKEGKPAVSKHDLENLRVAVLQEDGWLETLLGRASETDTTAPESSAEADSLRKSLERERAKALKQKEEARRLKDELKEERRRAEVAARTLERQISELSKRVASFEKQMVEAEKRADAASDERDRELRRARTGVAKADKEVDRLREDLRSARREAADNRRRVRELEDQLAKKKSKSSPRNTDSPPTGPRKPLPVPQGRFEEDPETLAAWIEAPGVMVFIDGYNVTRHESGYPNLSFSVQRERLLDGVERLTRRKKIAATIVWDAHYMTASERPAATVSRRSPVTEIFTAEGEIADDRIVDLLRASPPYPAVVATNDRELRERVVALGATVATSPQLLELLS